LVDVKVAALNERRSDMMLVYRLADRSKGGNMQRFYQPNRRMLPWTLLLMGILAAGCVSTSGAATVELPTTLPAAAPTVVPADLLTVAPIEPETVNLLVYFTNTTRYAAATPPFEEAVTRSAPAGEDLPTATLQAFFVGPTAEEKASGLEAITSGFTGLRELKIEDGIARVYLEGPCSSNGATYTIAQPILANLLQFKEVKAVKIYDAEGVTEVPEGMDTSIPYCLEP